MKDHGGDLAISFSSSLLSLHTKIDSKSNTTVCYCSLQLDIQKSTNLILSKPYKYNTMFNITTISFFRYQDRYSCCHLSIRQKLYCLTVQTNVAYSASVHQTNDEKALFHLHRTHKKVQTNSRTTLGLMALRDRIERSKDHQLCCNEIGLSPDT